MCHGNAYCKNTCPKNTFYRLLAEKIASVRLSAAELMWKTISQDYNEKKLTSKNQRNKICNIYRKNPLKTTVSTKNHRKLQYRQTE